MNKVKALVPRLRFPEFREAGEWDATSLREIGEIVTGKTPSTSDDSLWNGDIQFVTPTDISEEKYQWKTQRNIVSNARVKILPKNSTMFTCIASIGKMALSVKPCITNQQINTVIPKKGYENEFVYYSLLNIVPLIKATQANTTLPIINKTEFSKFTIPVPTVFAEQQKIADCLSSVDELIAAQARKVDALKTHKKGLMQQLFPREGETQPRLRFPGFKDAPDWEKLPLSELLKSLDAGLSVNSGDRPAMNSEIGVLKTSAVTNGIFEPQENKVVLDEVEIGRVKEAVLRDTIIISRMNTPALVGANAYVETSLENIFLPDRLWAAKSKPGTSMRFVAFILGSNKGRAALSKLAKGSSGSMKNITKPDVLAFLVMAPSSPEQQRIADCLTALDDLISAQAHKLDALNTHKKGLMQQLFPLPAEVAA